MLETKLKYYIQYDSIYMKYKKGQSYLDRKPISGCRRWSGGLGWVTKELFEGNGNFLYIDCGGGYKVCVCQNSLNYTNR